MTESFKYRFKRDMRIWTLIELQELLDKLHERNRPYELKREEIFEEILQEVDEGDNEIRLYYKDTDGDIMELHFSKSSEFGWGYSTRQFRLDTRDDKLDFLIDYERRLELGNKYMTNKRYISSLTYMVRDIMYEMMNDKLRNDLKDNPLNILVKSMVVTVGDRKYIGYNKNNGNYIDFEFSNYYETVLI